MCHRQNPKEESAMAKHVSGKSVRMWRVSSVWIKRRDGPERVLSAYRLLLDLPPRRTVRAVGCFELSPEPTRRRRGGQESVAASPHQVSGVREESESRSDTF
jgi:hypothetical protein